MAESFKCYIFNVYAPQDKQKKKELWNYMTMFMSQNQGDYIVFGDFNVVRVPTERYGSIFCPGSADDFNSFIVDTRLIDGKSVKKWQN